MSSDDRPLKVAKVGVMFSVGIDPNGWHVFAIDPNGERESLAGPFACEGYAISAKTAIERARKERR